MQYEYLNQGNFPTIAPSYRNTVRNWLIGVLFLDYKDLKGLWQLSFFNFENGVLTWKA